MVRTLVRSMLTTGAIFLASPCLAQATTRMCDVSEQAGPACLLSHKHLPKLPAGPLYWHLDEFRSKADAERSAVQTSSVVESFGSIWLFTLERAAWRPRAGRHVSTIGPLPVKAARTYSAEYLRSVFLPGATAPLHVHSGPEAFYALGGDTCLETPAGVQIGRGNGNSLVIQAGPPMLLMAIGRSERRGFALILHDAEQPPTTLTQAWQPSGLCARELANDQAKAAPGK